MEICLSHLLPCLALCFFSLRIGCAGGSLLGGGVDPRAIATVVVLSARGSLTAVCTTDCVGGSGVDGDRINDVCCELRKMLFTRKLRLEIMIFQVTLACSASALRRIRSCQLGAGSMAVSRSSQCGCPNFWNCGVHLKKWFQLVSATVQKLMKYICASSQYPKLDEQGQCTLTQSSLD